MTPSLKDLHDAALLSLHVNWAGAELRMDFEMWPPDKKARIVARGLTLLKCPRLLPWGPSIFVNGASIEQLENGLLLVDEMQSGDVIEASARDINLE